MKPTYNVKLVIPILLAGILAGMLAGCSGGADSGAASPAPGARLAMGGAPPTSWTSVKWAGGGYVTGLTYHPTTAGLMYARTDIGGAYRWNNSNGSWTPITDGIGFNSGESRYHGVESIGLDPANDQLVYLVAGMYTKDGGGNPANGRIYASSNRGNTWTHYDLPFPVGGNEGGRAIGERLKLDPTNPSTMFYASRTAGLWKSTNSGQTWTQTSLSSTVLTGAQIQAIGAVKGVEQIMFDNSNVGGGATTWIMYAAVAPDYGQVAGLTSTLYKSVNGGFSWTPVSVPSTVSGYYVPHMVRTGDGAYYVVFNKNAGEGAGGPGYLYKFGGVSGNESWTQLSSITTGGGYGGVSVSGTGSTARIALAVTGTWSSAGPVVQLSDNGGSTWREIAGGMVHYGGQFWGWIDDIEIDPANRDHIMHVTGGGVWETWNASSATPSWDFPNNNLEETATLAIVTPPAGAPYKFVNSAGDIGTWVQTDLATTPNRGPLSDWNNGNYADVLWSDPSYIVGSGINHGTSTVFGFWSGDSGVSWSNFATLPAGAAANHGATGSIATTSRNNVIWAPANSVPSYTTNNGASWTATNLPAPAAPGWDNGYRLVVDRKNPTKVYAYDSGGAFWGPAGKVYVSTDGGHNFTLSQGSVSANLAPNAYRLTSIAVNPNVEGDIWLTDGDTVYHSTNSGTSWTKLNGFASIAGTSMTEKVQGASTIALGKAQTGAPYSAAIYVVGTRNGVWGIYQSDDGGATWTRYNDDTHQYGGIEVMAGDWNTYGRIYFSGTGRGLIYTN
ncbi:dockerin [Pseudoduganella sp. LjRoot289]|uniref:sialidase family protein n=1 Tax=Pseudoduganella sp. LjRoot289 TaxID=3342314 RepID=UPI003F500EF3